MKLRILGSAGAEFPDFRPPAFLIDETLLLDAGTIGSVLSEEEQWNIRTIFITHAHLDHIRGIPALADNIIVKNLQHSVDVFAPPEVIDAMQVHLFNGVIWPDFTRLPSSESPVLRFHSLQPATPVQLELNGTPESYRLTAVPVHHTVPAVGYCVEHAGRRLVYTGDTGPTDAIWPHASGADALIVEVSFPNNQESLALLTQHLCCSLLEKELAKIKDLPKRILITHPKPQYYHMIKSEIEQMGIRQVELLRDGTIYDI